MSVLRPLSKVGIRGDYVHAASLASVALSLGLWVRGKTVDQDERGNAERRAIFVGLWAPTLWMLGDTLREDE